MANDFSFCSSSSYAKLSADELKSLGKEAALDFLGSGIALNDAVVKIAQRHPSISTHQIRRIVEFANQEAFSDLFEKQAGDKNIDFEIADPAEVIHIINSGVRPVEVTSLPEEYSSVPIKMASLNVEDDLALSQEFGIVLHSPTMEKVASCSFLEPSPADRILAKVATLNLQPKKNYVAGKITKLAFGEGAPVSPMAGSDPNAGMSADEHHERMLALQREIELAKKREELAKIQQRAMQDAGMVPPDQAQEDPNQMSQQGQPQMPPDQMAAAQPGMEQAAPAPQPEQPPQPFAGPMLAPPGAAVPKTASLLKEAMTYFKQGRPFSRLVEEDLCKAASLESIKTAVSLKEKKYPDANPHRELVETRQKIAQLKEEACSAADTNRFMAKEAADRFYKEAEQFLWSGGRLGEVLQMMECVSPSPMILKTASSCLVRHLDKRGLDKVAARADLISYEMNYGEKKRFVDTHHPVAESFWSFCKLAMNQAQLDESLKELRVLSSELDKTVQEVWKNDSSK